MQLTPIIDAAVAQLAPDFRALHLLVHAPDALMTRDADTILGDACRFALDGGPP